MALPIGGNLIFSPGQETSGSDLQCLDPYGGIVATHVHKNRKLHQHPNHTKPIIRGRWRGGTVAQHFSQLVALKRRDAAMPMLTPKAFNDPSIHGLRARREPLELRRAVIGSHMSVDCAGL